MHSNPTHFWVLLRLFPAVIAFTPFKETNLKNDFTPPSFPLLRHIFLCSSFGSFSVSCHILFCSNNFPYKCLLPLASSILDPQCDSSWLFCYCPESSRSCDYGSARPAFSCTPAVIDGLDVVMGHLETLDVDLDSSCVGNPRSPLGQPLSSPSTSRTTSPLPLPLDQLSHEG